MEVISGDERDRDSGRISPSGYATTEPSKDGKTCRKRQVSKEKGRAYGRLSP